MQTRTMVAGAGLASVLSVSGVIGAIAATSASGSGSQTVYQACLDTHRHVLVHVTTKAAAPQCGRHQHPVSWNATGAAGADGATVLSGPGAPAATTGQPGDFYLDTTSWLIYGPKSASGWPAGHALTGPAGKDGTNGQNGSNGLNGTDGADGNTVLSGPCDVDSGWNRVNNGTVETNCPPSGVGHNGDFYIDTTNQRIFGPLTDAGWGNPTSIVGPQGDAGSSVLSGGCDTDSGWDRVNNGTVEADCPPPMTVALNVDFFIDTTNWRIFGPLTDAGWGNPTSIIGPPNDAGTSITDLGDLDGLTCTTAGDSAGTVVTSVGNDNTITMTCQPDSP